MGVGWHCWCPSHNPLSDTRKTADVCGSNYPHWGRPGRTYCQAYRRQCGVRVVGAPEIRTPSPGTGLVQQTSAPAQHPPGGRVGLYGCIH